MTQKMKEIPKIETILLIVTTQAKKKMISCLLAKLNKKSTKEQTRVRIWLKRSLRGLNEKICNL